MAEIKNSTLEFLKKIDKKIVFIALEITFAISYYINLLDNIALTSWNRTFCPAVLSGISIDLRISNFYKFFFLYLPGISILLIGFLTWLFSLRENYKDYFSKISILLSITTFASYISRYTSISIDIVTNPMMQCLIAFFIVMTIISFLDVKKKFDFADITMYFITFMMMVISFNMLLKTEKIITNIVISAVIEISFVTIIIFAPFGQKIFEASKRFIFIMMWLPMYTRVALEGLYFLTERGYNIEHYFTYIIRACLLFILIAIVITLIFRKKEKSFTIFGYIGALTSITTVCSFAYSYQYIWYYSNFAHMYELGNVAVAMDSVLYGKLPIIDYFSAHALGDVWTKIIYYIIHNDINGIFIDPYSGLTNILAYIILFFIVKNFFDEHISVLYVMLFPGILLGIKWVSICSISVAMIIYIYKKPRIRSFIIFWITTLIGAFYTYDEGISLGVACILGYLIIRVIEKKWREIRNFIISGVSVGVVVCILYVIYALTTGVPVVSRIREWISVSLGSSSSWASANFGDQSSFAFLISYFVVPITAVALLVFVVIKYIKYHKNGLLALVTVVYALTEILYITRTVVYHNLAQDGGVTGVLLNFIHWTVSLYVLYVMSLKEKEINVKLFAWVGTMMFIILVEGTVVTHYWPSADVVLISKALKSSEVWDLQDNYTVNIGQDRIMLDEGLSTIVNQFKNVFDALLDEDETFVDFANVTYMYALTRRVRPCYVGQSPSLLTDLYSQECFLKEISKYSCPLAIVGTTETSYLQQMIGIPHNVRYYKIAEYIYNNYRPLVSFGEFAIWCENDKYDEFKLTLQLYEFENNGYVLIDYGYDFTTSYVDENGNMQFSFKPYHSYNLGMVPYSWANYDDYEAINNTEILSIEASDINQYKFEGSQKVSSNEGNYLVFEYTNVSNDNISNNIVFYDSSNEGAKVQYQFTVVPGTGTYMIRVSEDYFWDIYNIDTILFGTNEQLTVSNVKILEGD